MNIMDIDILVTLMNTGALVVISVLLIRGDVMPRKTVDKILEEAEKRANIMAAEIVKAMKDSVKDGVEAGIISGVLKVNGQDSKKK
jgi:predicted glycosyltransferase